MKRCLSLLLLALALAVPATASATTYGAEVGGDFLNQTRGLWSAADVMSSLNALYSAGGRLGRTDSDWAGAEPHAPVHGHAVFHWGYNDMIVSEMAQARLSWEPTLEFTPKWAQQRKPHVLHLKTGRFVTPLPPAKNSTYATYVSAFIRRYGPHGSFWAAHRTLPYRPVTTVEIWNEPDENKTWGPDVNLSDYAKLYETARTAIHRVTRGVRVMTGGLAWTQSSLPRLLKAFKGKPIDAVAVHTYGKTPKTTIALARFALSEMRQYGRGRTPVIVNEYGWTSARDTWGSTSPKHVKSYVYQALVGLSKLRLAQIIPYAWSDPSWGLSDGTFKRAVAKATHNRL
jgi:hypothetical protein